MRATPLCYCLLAALILTGRFSPCQTADPAAGARTQAKTAQASEKKAKPGQPAPEAVKPGTGNQPAAEKAGPEDPMSSGKFSGLKFRTIGPAYCSGRIGDFAVNPSNTSEYYVAVASGHIWKTINSGTTWTPVFDNQGAYSIGCLAMDPGNSNVVWAGTGENNHQRALGYGNGVHKTMDGGKSWKNMGLKESRQIGGIVIDPRNSNVVYVAAEGSVWGPGGDRGLYKTTDGGNSWVKILEVSENTGINNIVMDPRNPDLLYATSEQRRRHVFTKIGGGPETAIYKSEDAGKNWRKLNSGLPAADKGGIGIAISPVKPDVVYAIIEAAEGQGGFFRSTDRGESWSKMSSHTSSGQYYNEIYCDPLDVDKIYSVETVTALTEDAGKTWRPLGNKARHVDDHALWIDPRDTSHFLIGGDGGIYESFDGGQNYLFKSNLPVTQFYRVAVDQSLPFYYVYGGTQDNSSMGGPSRTIRSNGIANSDWFVTQGGDGFWSAIDPENPDIVYAEAQYGDMTRYDRRSGETLDIRPQPRPGELSYRWNWDTPLFISPHSAKRLYCAANKVFRSDDRGESWAVISDDITAGIDRNTWPVMGKFWSTDALAKDVSTSLYGTIVSLDESPLKENLLVAGTDDGLLQISEDARGWRKCSGFPGVPPGTYVSDVLTSRFDGNAIFASFNNHQRDDFKPYLLKSTDQGKSWVSIAANLPENGPVHCIAQDFENPDLLFTGTEFGFFFSADGGQKWIQLKSGLPDIPVRDIAIQKREHDLVLATFGRGFYVLDNYAPLRLIKPALLEQEAFLFPVKNAPMYVQQGGLYGQGSTYFTADNPPFGAVFTAYLKTAPKTRKELRKEKEKELFKEGKPIPQPTEAELRAEADELPPHFIFTVTDETGGVVRRLAKAASAGISRTVWDLTSPDPRPVSLKEKFDPLAEPARGIPVMPGRYRVGLALCAGGTTRPLGEAVTFEAVPLNLATLPAADRAELAAFQKTSAGMARVIDGAEQLAEEMLHRVQTIRQALQQTPGASAGLMEKAAGLAGKLDEILYAFRGRTPKASSEENPPAPVPLRQRMEFLIYSHWRSTSGVTPAMRTAASIVKSEFPPVLERIRQIHESDLPALEKETEASGAPWTPGRLPVWNY